MASEEPPSGDSSALERLTKLLTATSDTPPTARELAELLWLARQSDGPQESGEPDGPHGGQARAADDAREAPRKEDPAGPPEQPPPTPPPDRRSDPPRTPPSPGERIPLHLPGPGHRRRTGPGGAGDRPLLAPAPPMLPAPLALQRALRPLKRTVASARARVVDERATADRIARLGAHPDVWLPVLRPARERWLRLNLVHDTGPTMPVWRPLVRELHTVLAQSGVFRTVALRAATPDGRAGHVPDAADGRTVTLVLSDCMGPQWRPGPAGDRWYATLRHWAARMPLAVVQPLPERLWPTTALPAEPGLLASPAAAAPLCALRFTPYDPDAGPVPPGCLPLPVLEPGAPWLANWAALVAAPGGARTPGAAALLTPSPVPCADGGAPDPAALPAQDLVLRFRATASPEAFRLAGHLALAVPSVPVMRLVQRAVNRDPRPQHLAEVILSGMLTTVPGPPGSYDFRPGVRELLLRTLPRTTRGRTRELLDRVGGLIDARAGLTAGDFRATAAATGSEATGAGPAFATVSEQTLRRLGAGHGGPTGGTDEGRTTGNDGPAVRSPGAGPSRTGTVLRFETGVDLTARPEARITLELVVHDVLARGDLTPQQYEIRVRKNGYLVEIRPDAYLLPVLAAALRRLPGPLADLAEPPHLRVTFGGGPPAPAGSAPVLLTVEPALYDAFTRSSAAGGPHRFRPLYGDGPDARPLAWCCPLPAPRGEDEERDLVRGPLLTRDLGQLGMPAPGRTAIVHTGPEGPLALLDPADAHRAGPSRPATYYEVDLVAHHAVHRITLPSSGKGEFTAAAELTWRVADPVAFVRAQAPDVAGRLLAHLREAGARITRHHSVRRAAGAQRAVNAQLGGWPVPGLAVTCAVTLAPDYAPPPEVRRADTGVARTPEDLLAEAETVLFGFDGPLTRLFTAATAREAALDLLAVVAEHRDPEDALAGRAASGSPGPAAARELSVHPLDVLRAFARDRLGPLLRERLDHLELSAVPDAPTTHHSVVLVRTLQATGRRVGVVTDVCEQAVRLHLESHRLVPSAGVHGRADDLDLLMPNPQGLLRALRPLGAAAATGVLVGSTLAELAAARAAGLRFVGLARNPTVARALDRAGCDVTVASLAPVLEAARALG